MPGGEKIPVPEFAAKIKEKNPQYKDVNDTLLTQKIIEKYPSYKDMVDYEPQQPKLEPKQAEPYPSNQIANTAGLINPEGTYNNDQSAYNSLASIVSGNNIGVQDRTVPIQAVKVGKDTSPDIGEAIDNTIAQKNKNFTVSKDAVKVQKDAIAKAYKNGDLVLRKNSKGESVLKKGTGLADSFLNAVNKVSVEEADNKNLASLDTQGKIDYLKAKSLDEDNSAPSGILGKVGEFAGENASLLAKTTTGALSGGALAPEMIGAANVGSFIAIADQLAKGGSGNLLQKTYSELKQQNPQMSDVEAMQHAEKVAPIGAATSLATGAILSGIPEGLAASKSGFVKALTKSMSYEVPKMASVSGGESLVNNVGEMAAGVKKKPSDIIQEVGESAAHGAVIGAAFYTMMHPMKVLSYLRPQAENVIASMPAEQRDAYLKTAQQNGVIPEGAPEAIEKKVQEFTKAKEPIETLPIPEENKAAIAGKILQKQKLVEEKNNLAKHGDAFLPRIEELDGQIKDIEKQMSGMYNAKDVFAKEKDSLTGEKANEVSHEQATTDFKEANDLGFEHPAEAINSVNKHTGSDYSSFQEIPKDVLQQVSEQRKINTDAVQVGSAEKIFQPAQETVGERGSERGGMEPVEQGQEIAGTGTENSGSNEAPKEEIKQSKNIPQPVQEFTSKQGHTLKSENGAITVTNKEGKEVSRPTRKKVIREAAESYDFTQGEVAPTPGFEPANDKEFTRHVIEKTSSPSELAEVYINEQPESADLSTKEQMIADYGIGKITEDSYRRHGDRNNQNHNKARAYFNKNGTPIDSLAKEIGDHYGVDISPQDVVDFIDRFPNGADAALSERESSTAVAAKDRFSELTGLPLDREVAAIAIDQQFKKLSKEQQDLANQDYETRQQLEDEYWKHFSETNGTSKESADTQTQQTEETVEPTKPISNRERAEEIAKEILSYRSGNSKLYGGIAGVTTAIYDGMLSTAANIIRAGGSIMDAIDAAVNYVQSNSPRADIEKVKQFLHDRFKVPYVKPTAAPNNLMQGTDVADTGARLHALDQARAKIEEGVKEKKLSLWDKFSKLAIDSQQEMLKRLGEMGAKGKVVRDYLITTKGSTARADAMFDEAKEAIYGGINGFKKVMVGGEQMRIQALLNKLITLKRTIDIDKKMADKFNEFESLRKRIATLKATDPANPAIQKFTNDLDNVRQYLDKNDVLKYENGKYSLGQYRHPFGYTSDFAKADLANIEKEHPELFKELDNRSNLLSGTFHKLIDLKEEAGILSKESADALREYYYAPRADINNFINSETENNTKPGKAVKDRQGIKSLEGGTENLNEDNYDVQLHKAVMNTMRDISLNNAGKKLLDAVRADKNNKYMHENTPQIYSIGRKAGQLVRDKYGNVQYDAVPSGKAKIKVWDNGKPVEIVADQRLVDSWYDAQKTSGFVQSLGKFTGAQVIRGAITGYNPGFGIFQLLVDPQSAVVASGLYKTYFGGIATVYKDMAKVSPHVFSPHGVTGIAAEARDYGAFTSFSRGEDVLNLRSDVDVNKRKALRALRATAEAFNWVNDRAENLTRTALYSRSKELALAKYKKINGTDAVGQDLEDIKVQAAHDARRYVDFARGGEYAKEANKIFPYLNSAIQLKRSVIAAAAKNPIRLATMTGEAVAAGLGVMAYSLGLGWASHGLSDEEKKKRLEAFRNVNQVTRSKYFLMYKGEDKDGKPQFWRMEKPMILNVAINAAEKGLLNHYYKDVDFNHLSTAQDIASLSPVDQTIVSRNPAVNAILKGYANKDFYFNTEVVRNADNITDYLEGTDNKKTKDFYIWLGKKAKDIGVEDGISPLRTQAAVESFIGDPAQNPIVNLLTSTMAISFDLSLGNTKALNERLAAFKDVNNYLNFTTLPKRLIAQPSDLTIEELNGWKEKGARKADRKVLRKAHQMGRTEL